MKFTSMEISQMKILVCGGRDYSDQAATWAALDKVHKKHGITLVIDGDASGADRHAFQWAQKMAFFLCDFRHRGRHWGAKLGLYGMTQC